MLDEVDVNATMADFHASTAKADAEAEAGRTKAEQGRLEDAQGRSKAEESRLEAEQGRTIADRGRIQAEQKRAERAVEMRRWADKQLETNKLVRRIKTKTASAPPKDRGNQFNFISPDGTQLEAVSELGTFSPAPFKPSAVASLPPKSSIQAVPNISSIRKSRVSLDGAFQAAETPPPARKKLAPPEEGYTQEEWQELQHTPPADWDAAKYGEWDPQL